VKRGGAYWINLEASSPPELGKVRSGIVVSNSIQNERLDSVVIVPLSSRAPEIATEAGGWTGGEPFPRETP